MLYLNLPVSNAFDPYGHPRIVPFPITLTGPRNTAAPIEMKIMKRKGAIADVKTNPDTYRAIHDRSV
jgi:hypothetical protein